MRKCRTMPYKDKAQQAEYQRRWKAERRARYTADQVCRECGSAENINWHHRDPSTKVSHRIWSWSIERLEAELAKCIPLCNVCHTRLHCAQHIVHGTATGYSHYGCRCRRCLDAQNAYNREYLRRKRAANAS